MKDPRAQKILNDVYNSNDSNFSLLTEEDKKLINIIVENIDSLKAVATALITSLVKKVLDPSQDVRYHKIDFGNPEFDKKGYSARSFDTENITPWVNYPTLTDGALGFPVTFTTHLHFPFRVFTHPRPVPLVKARAMVLLL